jgi:uncharacterized protein YwqG
MIDLQALIEKHGLAEHQAAIHQIARTMIRITAKKERESKIAIGNSKMGGDPDLPEGMEWPVYNGRPMSFLLQLNLADLKDFRSSKFKAKEGMLYFFCEPENWKFEEGSYSVVFSPKQSKFLKRIPNPASHPPSDNRDGDNREKYNVRNYIGKLVQVDKPLDIGGSYNSASVMFSEELSLPEYRSPTVSRMFGKDEVFMGQYDEWKYQRKEKGEKKCSDAQMIVDFEVFNALRGKYSDLCGDWILEGKLSWEDCKDFTDHHMFGYCNPFQWEPALREGELLLLQIDTDDGPGWMWGDVGKLYFWILESELLDNDFSKVQVEEQCG